MKRLLHTLGGVLFGLALLALAWLLLPDLWTHFLPSLRHQRAGSLALMFAGASLICFQFGTGKRWGEMLKGLLLGLAFFLWGCEHFMPHGSLVTSVDSAVIAIFVADLGLVIAVHWKRPPKN